MAIERETNGYAFEKILISEQPKSLNPKILSQGAKKAFLTLEAGSVRYLYHGENPNDSTGHILEERNFLVIDGQSKLSKIRFVRFGDFDATASVTYERE